MQQEAPTKVSGDSATGVRRDQVLTYARWLGLFALIVATVGGALVYWRHSTVYPSTDNAYIGTDIVRVAAEVSGPVTRVYARDNEPVAANDPLFDIDPAPYDAALREARAQFDRAVQAAGDDGQALNDAAAKLDETRVALIEARLDYQRASDAAAGEDSAEAERAWRDALAAFAEAQQQFDESQDADLPVAAQTVALRSAAAAFDKATHDRVRTHVSAPTGGWVSDMSVRPGTTVGSGTPLFAIIEGTNWWVDANFKETDLARIRAGQPATVHVDLYPDRVFEGTVSSISAGSGAVFSLLPPENATGNWVKVTQRFTVRVEIDEPDGDADRPLRVGASAYVSIDTTQDSQ